MSARNQILAALARHPAPPVEPVRPASRPEMPPNPWSVLAERLAQNGGRLVHARSGEWIDSVRWPREFALLTHIYVARDVPDSSPAPPASQFSSTSQLPSTSKLGPLTSRGVGATAKGVRDLEPLEVTVLHAEFAVAENGAVWHVPASPLERAAALLAEHLIVLVPASSLVATLHHAYERIALAETRFGWFLSGPSKTADIEQSLVLGAHGPRTMQLVAIES